MAQDLDEERKPGLLAELSGPLHAIVGAEAGGLAAGGGGGGPGCAAVVRMALHIMVELVSGEGGWGWAGVWCCEGPRAEGLSWKRGRRLVEQAQLNFRPAAP
jgi:hypothetical protein